MDDSDVDIVLASKSLFQTCAVASDRRLPDDASSALQMQACMHIEAIVWIRCRILHAVVATLAGVSESNSIGEIHSLSQ